MGSYIFNKINTPYNGRETLLNYLGDDNMTKDELIEAGKERFANNYGTQNQRRYASMLMENGYETEAYLSLALGKVREQMFVHALKYGADHLATCVYGEMRSKLLSIWFDDQFIDE